MRRGDVFRLRLEDGTEEIRYGVVVQAETLSRLSTVLVAPTSSRARKASFRPEVAIDGKDLRVLVEQAGAIEASRLGEYQGRLTPEELWGVNLALVAVFDLQ